MTYRTSAEMYPLVAEWEQSPQIKSVFCKEGGLNIHTFTYWLQKYRKENQTLPVAGGVKNFISLQVKGSLESDIELSYPNGVQLRLKGALSLPYLSSLIQLAV